jgi:MarR family transcriptional regulator, transcriptional regulator for hemolysin
MATTHPPVLGIDLTLLLSRASHALQTAHAAALAEIGISLRSFCVLCKASTGELTQIQLAEACDLDKTTMVVTVDELERAGLAERRPSPTDRRARIISVTGAGQAKLAEGRRIVDRVHEEVLATLPDREREVFLAALTSLVESRLGTPMRCDPPVRRGRPPRAP